MLFKNFNKLGGTEFRVKDQIQGQTILANFLLNYFENEGINEIDIKTINEHFILFTKKEQIYSYKKNDKIKNRFLMVSKLLKQIELIEIKNNLLSLNKQFILDFLKSPTEFLFNKFNDKFPFWKKVLIS